MKFPSLFVFFVSQLQILKAPMILVTGGAGFIGSNFVVNLDKLTYAGNLNNLFSLQSDARHIFVKGDTSKAASDHWAPEHERSILWNDESLAIAWPLDGQPELSSKDMKGALLADAEVFT